MFCRKWDRDLDEKWRLIIPAEIKKFRTQVILKENDDGCIQLHKPSSGFKNSSIWFKVRLTKSNKKTKRITIPLDLHNSVSFYFGRKVTIVEKENYLVIWPRFTPAVKKRRK